VAAAAFLDRVARERWVEPGAARQEPAERVVVARVRAARRTAVPGKEAARARPVAPAVAQALVAAPAWLEAGRRIA